MKTPSFPLTVKKGNSVVKIYRHARPGYDEFKVAYYAEGRRKMETFADYEDARERADEINESVNDGNAEVLTLTGVDRLVFTRATAALRVSGVPLDTAAVQYAEALQMLAGGSLIEAARHYVKYGWSHPEGQDNKGERFVAVLEIPPVDSPETAVKIAIAAEVKGKK